MNTKRILSSSFNYNNYEIKRTGSRWTVKEDGLERYQDDDIAEQNRSASLTFSHDVENDDDDDSRGETESSII
jgi:hypothetical protein